MKTAPISQPQFAAQENHSCRQLGLVMAPIALNQLSRLQFAVGSVATLRASESFWPVQLEQNVMTGLFGVIPSEKIDQT